MTDVKAQRTLFVCETDSDVCFHSNEKQQQSQSDRLENVTQTISKLLQGYDIRLRPNFGGESRISFVCDNI
jgi:hypothetical protein